MAAEGPSHYHSLGELMKFKRRKPHAVAPVLKPRLQEAAAGTLEFQSRLRACETLSQNQTEQEAELQERQPAFLRRGRSDAFLARLLLCNMLSQASISHRVHVQGPSIHQALAASWTDSNMAPCVSLVKDPDLILLAYSVILNISLQMYQRGGSCLVPSGK